MLQLPTVRSYVQLYVSACSFACVSDARLWATKQEKQDVDCASCSEPQTVAMKIPAELPIDADDFKGQSILIFKLALLLQLVKEQFCFLS